MHSLLTWEPAMCEKARGKHLLKSAESASSDAVLLVQMSKIFARNRACVSVSGEVAMSSVLARKLYSSDQMSHNVSGRALSTA